MGSYADGWGEVDHELPVCGAESPALVSSLYRVTFHHSSHRSKSIRPGPVQHSK